ncbi:MAG: hypothetical protein ACFB3T_14385 [Geminicoccaceae bacterium]
MAAARTTVSALAHKRLARSCTGRLQFWQHPWNGDERVAFVDERVGTAVAWFKPDARGGWSFDVEDLLAANDVAFAELWRAARKRVLSLAGLPPERMSFAGLRRVAERDGGALH